ncbi:reticulon-1-like [Scleropages formosus]|uniref:Reticulon n=1 Tax=Scleropages formosus TaxID=113540 RepID=A0A0P7UI99_SCLFO|nr:reticulon-1-like [Scleropages formosus]
MFGSVLLLLFSLTQFSVVSVGAYLALAALSATISFRVYKSVLQAVQKTDEGHPFKTYLEMEISLSQEQIQKYADMAQQYLNCTLKELRRLFLVQDLVDSLKFAVLMWLLTYVGALFNGLTLLILGEELPTHTPTLGLTHTCHDSYNRPPADKRLGSYTRFEGGLIINTRAQIWSRAVSHMPLQIPLLERGGGGSGSNMSVSFVFSAVVSMFTMPVVYEKYQAQIDQYLGLVRTHVNCVVGKIQEKIPGAKRKTE